MATLTERKSEYEAHETAGKDYYNSFRSQLTLDIEAETKTLEEALEISKRLECVGHCLNNGDWKSASVEIDKVLANVHCPQSVIDSMKTDILNYITANYSW